MSVKLGAKDLFPYLGDYRPVNIYKGENKIAGWKWAEQSGEELYFENTYNDFVEVEIGGNSVNDFDVVSSVGGRNLVENSKLIEYRYVTNQSIFVPRKTGSYTISFDYEILEENEPITRFLLYSNRNIGTVPIKASEDRTTLTFQVTEEMLGASINLYGGHNAPASRANVVDFIEVKVERGNVATNWAPAPEDITENDNHPLIDKINLSLPQDYQDKLKKLRSFRDSNYVYTTGSIEPQLIGKVKVKDV